MNVSEVRHHVSNALARYAECADECDATGLGDLLSEAELIFAGTALVGRDAIIAHYLQLFAHAPRSRHLMSNLIVEVIGATSASARCRYLRLVLEPTAALVAIGDTASNSVVAEGSGGSTGCKSTELGSNPIPTNSDGDRALEPSNSGAMGLSHDATQSALRAVIACAKRPLTLSATAATRSAGRPGRSAACSRDAVAPDRSDEAAGV